jgi:hypothetical protein
LIGRGPLPNSQVSDSSLTEHGWFSQWKKKSLKKPQIILAISLFVFRFEFKLKYGKYFYPNSIWIQSESIPTCRPANRCLGSVKPRWTARGPHHIYENSPYLYLSYWIFNSSKGQRLTCTPSLNKRIQF